MGLSENEGIHEPGNTSIQRNLPINFNLPHAAPLLRLPLSVAWFGFTLSKVFLSTSSLRCEID